MGGIYPTGVDNQGAGDPGGGHRVEKRAGDATPGGDGYREVGVERAAAVGEDGGGANGAGGSGAPRRPRGLRCSSTCVQRWKHSRRKPGV